MYLQIFKYIFSPSFNVPPPYQLCTIYLEGSNSGQVDKLDWLQIGELYIPGPEKNPPRKLTMKIGTYIV